MKEEKLGNKFIIAMVLFLILYPITLYVFGWFYDTKDILGMILSGVVLIILTAIISFLLTNCASKPIKEDRK